jgi:hypothetical protein
VTRVSLTAFAPGQCDWGHYLGPGRVLNGFLPCLCPGVLAAGRPNGAGHVTVQCRGCLEEGRETIWFDPPHSG